MSQPWINQFESHLDVLEREASSSTTAYSSILRFAQAACSCLADCGSVSAFLVRAEVTERISENGQTLVVATEDHSRLLSVAEFGATITGVHRSSSPHESSIRQLTVVHPLANNLSFLLEVAFTELIAPQQSFTEGLQAIAAVLGTFVSRQLLSQYETRLSQQTTLFNVVARMHSCESATEAASVLVQDGAAVLGDCRLTILLESEGDYNVVAVTGVKQPKTDSASVSATQSLAVAVAQTRLPDHWIAINDLSDGEFAGEAAILRQSGVSRLRAIPLKLSSERAGTTPSAAENTADTPAMLIVEIFNGSSIPEDNVLNQLVAAAVPVFHKLHCSPRSWFAAIIRGRLRRRLLIGTTIVALLAFWPAKFEVEVNGQIESINQRRIFAPENGTVDEVFFKNETAVLQNQPLLTMSNPDLDLERQRVLGDIETTSAKLASVRAIQITDGDARSSGDEQQLEKQLDNFRKQLELIELQTESLHVVAPFDGTVFLRNPRKELAQRPVQRGQLLFEIVPNEDAWQLDLNIPDHLIAYVDSTWNKDGAIATVRFRIKAAPEQDWTTSLTKVDNAVQVVDGQLVCRATAELTNLPSSKLRPGTSVVARISCGRRSLGFVWFREVIELWQQFRFAWM